MTRHPDLPHRVRGHSLVELAVVLVAIGLVTMLLVQFIGMASMQRSDVAGRDLLKRADDSLLAFAMVHGRLPCPAADGDGVEDCAAGQVGRLPWRTLGLPDANARHIRYGVLRRAADRKVDADLARSIDRFDPMQVVGGVIGTELPVGNVNGLDLCWALRTAQDAPANPAYLHVTRPDAPTSLADNVAYAVALPAPGERFGGRQATSTPAFDSPRRRSGVGYSDRVLAVGLDQLWTRMRCGDNVAPAAHAHFNTAASIALIHTSLKDYKSQLAISKQMADANVENGGAAMAGALAGLSSAGGGMADTISEGLASTGVTSYRIALAVVSIAAAVGALATAGFMLDASIDARDEAGTVLKDVDPLIDDAALLEPLVLENAKAADAEGIY